MQADLLDLCRQASRWTAEKVGGARDCEAATPRPEWRVRDLLDHILDTQRSFAGAAGGKDAAPPAPSPPSLLTVDPTADVARARAEVMDAYAGEGVVERTGPALDIAFGPDMSRSATGLPAHTALTRHGSRPLRIPIRRAPEGPEGRRKTSRCGWRGSGAHRAGHRARRSGLSRDERRV